MINSIDARAAVSSLGSNQALPGVDAKSSAQENSFGQWLQHSLNDVHDMQQQSDRSVLQLVSGENKDVHGTMIAMQKASISFNLVMQVRNKVIAAYEEVKRMQF